VSVASEDRSADQSGWRFLAAVSAGNAFEWFDFVLYGYFAGAIAKNFFPLGNSAISLLVALAVFGVAFVVRPLGALVIGHYGDSRGRKPALLMTFFLMALGTVIIAGMPSFAIVGFAAPILIVCARLLQGFSAGGEFGSATALLAEQSPRHRGFFTSLEFVGQAFAAVLATSAGVLVTGSVDAEQLVSWGWRIPFLFGLSLVPLAYYIRLSVRESPAFLLIQSRSLSARRVFTEAWRSLLLSTGLVAFLTATTYTLIFMPTFAVEKLGLPPNTAFLTALLTSLLQAIIIPISGFLSDRLGRASIGAVVIVAMLLSVYPLSSRMTVSPSLASLLTFQLLIGSLVAGYAGVLPAMMADLFPTHIRATGTSISYALAVSIFGFFAPLINSLLVELTGDKIAPAHYLFVAALISLVALSIVIWRGHIAVR
jgi:MHS family proline/betaine transporter-like MFS transporter